MNWKHLESIDQLNTAVMESNHQTVVLFKHSTKCSVSVMAKRMLESQWSHSNNVTPYFLDLLNHREISNEIASRFGIRHESPQVVVLKDGIVIHSASHNEIDQADFA